MKLKMYIAGKCFSKICVQKLSEIPSFQIGELRSREECGET